MSGLRQEGKGERKSQTKAGESRRSFLTARGSEKNRLFASSKRGGKEGRWISL